MWTLSPQQIILFSRAAEQVNKPKDEKETNINDLDPDEQESALLSFFGGKAMD